MADVVVAGLGLGFGSGWRAAGPTARRGAAIVACMGLLTAGACGGGNADDDRPGATVPDGAGEDSSSTTTTAPAAAAIDITKKPVTVTVEYADAVMDELDRILSDAIREFVAADGPTK